MPESNASQNSALLQGLILLGLIIFGIYLVHERGLVAVLLTGDRSYLSLVIFSAWGAMSVRWLYLLRYVQQWRDRLAVPQQAASTAILNMWKPCWRAGSIMAGWPPTAC